MTALPINLSVRGLRVLIVGGGTVAARKAALLREHGALITVVSPEFGTVLAAMEGIQRVCRCYRRGDLDGCSLVVSATNVEAVNRQVHEDASGAGIPVNVADNPELCTVTFPAVIRRGDLTIAISTGGGSPALATRIRRLLEDTLGQEYGLHLGLLAEIRGVVKDSGLTGAQRARLLKDMAEPAIRDIILLEGIETARAALLDMLDQARGESS